jgi:membrane protein
VLGIAGTILQLQQADPTSLLLGYITQTLPPVSPEFEELVAGLLRGVIGQSAGLLSVGTIFFIWVATRLVGTLRTVLSEIFDIQQRRGFLSGKLFDLKMVIAAGTLFALNVALTIGAEIVARFGEDMLGARGLGALDVRFLYGSGAAFATLWLMFLLIYRFLPAHRIPWRTALLASAFTALFFELMKQGFSWYVRDVADFSSIYGGPIATAIVLILWIYYSAVVFILGGEVAQVAALRRIRKRQRERLVS